MSRFEEKQCRAHAINNKYKLKYKSLVPDFSCPIMSLIVGFDYLWGKVILKELKNEKVHKMAAAGTFQHAATW